MVATDVEVFEAEVEELLNLLFGASCESIACSPTTRTTVVQ